MKMPGTRYWVVLFVILVSNMIKVDAVTCPVLQICNDCYLDGAGNCRILYSSGTTETACSAYLLTDPTLRFVTFTPEFTSPCYYYPSSCSESLHYIMSKRNTISTRLGGCSNGCNEVTMTTTSDVGVDMSIIPDETVTFSSRQECTTYCVDKAFDGNDCTSVYSGTTCSIYTSCPIAGCPTTLQSGAILDKITCDHSVLKCPIPLDPLNGVAVYTTTLVGDMTNYTCKPGFHISGGQASVECQADGSWNSGPPTCAPDAVINCTTLTDPANGVVNTSGTTYPSSAGYTCNDGYILNGSKVRTCENDGNWTDTMPTCDPVHCGQPLPLLNGEFSLTSEYFMGITAYKCNDGFTLTGLIERTCRADGFWNGSEPSCNPVNCGTPYIIDNGTTTFTTTTYLSTVNYTCDNGSTLVGSVSRTCNSNGSWSGADPYCTSGCGPPENIAYGEVSYTRTEVNSKATYSCNVTGCSISLPGFVTCLSNNTWSLPTPFCTCVTCVTLNHITNGIVTTTDDNNVGSKASYTCNPGYELSSPNIRVCQLSGLWSSSEPTCTAKVPGALYVAACLCNDKREFANMTEEEILKQLTESTRIDESQTTLAQQKLNCRMDGRVSSTIVGTVGSAILASMFCVILILDCTNVVNSCLKRYRQYKAS